MTTENNNTTAKGPETKSPVQASAQPTATAPKQAASENMFTGLSASTKSAQPATAPKQAASNTVVPGINASIKQEAPTGPYAQKMEPLKIPTPATTETPAAPAAAASNPEAPKAEAPKTPAAPTAPVKDEAEPEAMDMIQRYLKMNGVGAGSALRDLIEDVRVDDEGGSYFKMLNGSELFMGIVNRPGYGAAEYVGVYEGAFTENTAQAIVMAAIDKGWTSVNLHGAEKKKDMMFIAATKAGLHVNPESYVPDPKKLEKWLAQGILSPEDLDGSAAPKTPSGATENKVETPEQPKAEDNKPAEPKTSEPATPQMQITQKWTESGKEFQKNFNVDLPIPAAPKGAPVTKPQAEQQAQLMSRIEKDMAKVQQDIDTRQANTKSESHPNGRINQEWVEKKQNMQRTLNNINKRLENNETMPKAQFTRLHEHYKNGDYKKAADVSGLKVRMKDQGMKVQTPTTSAPAEQKAQQTAKKPQKMTM